MGGLVTWGQVRSDGASRPVAWRDITAELGPVRFPHSTVRHFRLRKSVRLYLHDVMPQGTPTAPPIPAGHEVIFVVAGPRSSSGYDVRIVSVVKKSSRVVVTAREITPALGQRVVPGLTFPYRLILIRRIRKPVHLVWQGRP